MWVSPKRSPRAAFIAWFTSAEAIERLTAAATAYGNVNSAHDLIEHPQLHTHRMPVGGRCVDMPAVPWLVEWEPPDFAPAPRLDEHGPAIRADFAPAA
jgi:itaconate CoA-transferase